MRHDGLAPSARDLLSRFLDREGFRTEAAGEVRPSRAAAAAALESARLAPGAAARIPQRTDSPTEAQPPAQVLVVDDEPTNRDLLRRRRKHLGHHVLTALDGHSALSTLADENVDLMLLDLKMPGMDGFQVLSAMREDENLHRVPVIVISALDDMEGIVRCIELGADDYLPKPSNPVLPRARVHASLERKRLQDREWQMLHELQQSYERWRQAERRRDDLTHMIVHDPRQPLTSFLAGIRLLEMVGPLTHEQERCVEIATSGGEMLISMVNDMLDISRLEEGELQLDLADVPVRRLFEEAKKQVDWLAQDKKIAFRAHVPDDAGSVKADEPKLTRVLVNLLGNAVKFTPEEGAIDVSASREPDAVTISVKDTGEGIPQEALGRIFDKFGHVETRQSGRMASSGLGLTFCKLVVEARGGSIDVSSVPGEGSEFVIRLPNR